MKLRRFMYVVTVFACAVLSTCAEDMEYKRTEPIRVIIHNLPPDLWPQDELVYIELYTSEYLHAELYPQGKGRVNSEGTAEVMLYENTGASFTWYSLWAYFIVDYDSEYNEGFTFRVRLYDRKNNKQYRTKNSHTLKKNEMRLDVDFVKDFQPV